ncbi:MAG TPA: DUF4105 domain-containing protein [Rubricoccaceae bacterium]|nr:DUF4105 domain-containing protein [Rubricoccaceae bacterium]
MRRAVRVVALLALALLLVGLGACALKRPSHERRWAPEQAVLPHVEIDGDTVRIANVRNFTWTSAERFTPRYEERVYDLDLLDRVWYVVSPLSEDWRGLAHTFLTFGFADSQYVSLSVEARRERDEVYAPVKGALRAFELMVVIGDERDVLGLRAVTWNTPTYLYPGRATPAQVRELFVTMLRRAQAVERRPEFYHTLSNNCTTNILEAVNEVREEPIPYGLRVLLPGYSDELAYEQGLIDTDLPLDSARAAFRINARAAAAWGAPDFSSRLRQPG